MTTTVLIRDTNGNTLGTFDLDLDPGRIDFVHEAHWFDSGAGIVVTLVLKEGEE